MDQNQPNDAISAVRTLELTSLPERHPRAGKAFYEQMKAATVFRLSVIPSQLASDIIRRSVTVNWINRETRKTLLQELFIGWEAVALDPDILVQMRWTGNKVDMTAQAAIAVMALLIHELEGGAIQSVLDIGNGGDYLVLTQHAKRNVQAEVSGVTLDPSGSQTRSRLVKKCNQVLKKSRSGFASVTTFSHKKEAVVHSHLHFIRRCEWSKKPVG